MTTCTPKPVFEHIVCPRCGGTGRYSYNAMHGDRCYGCSGKGYKLTKRGAAAVKFYSNSMSTPAAELQPGTKVHQDVFRGMCLVRVWATLSRVEPAEGNKVTLHYEYKGEAQAAVIGAEDLVRCAHSAERKHVLQELALAYQQTLTKAGIPSRASAQRKVLDSQ